MLKLREGKKERGRSRKHKPVRKKVGGESRETVSRKKYNDKTRRREKGKGQKQKA